MSAAGGVDRRNLVQAAARLGGGGLVNADRSRLDARSKGRKYTRDSPGMTAPTGGMICVLSLFPLGPDRRFRRPLLRNCHAGRA